MSDKKISEFPVVSTVSATAILPLVDEGINKSVSIGVLAQNLPNLGNKGITKNVVIQATVQSLPVNVTYLLLADLGTFYILPNGVDGQEITLFSDVVAVVNVASGKMLSMTFAPGSVATLVFIAAVGKWFLKNSTNVVVA
jgi:hypothetical protein